MKTKLLKKIRKRFVIEYYPLGVPYYDFKKYEIFLSDKKYKLIDNDNSYFVFFGFTKEECLDKMLNNIRSKYSHKSRKNKLIEIQNKPIKVWYGK